MNWNFHQTYTQLPSSLFSRVLPEKVPQPGPAILNTKLADELGLDTALLSSPQGVSELAGCQIPKGADPFAQAYAGHQFGSFTMLGDGRAIILGEHLDSAKRRWDVQLKGSGRTPYSRRGDGKAALGPMLREYIISEAMHALNIPTTRSLAVVTTGEEVYRETQLPGAVLTRIAASHIRVGTFQYIAITCRLHHKAPFPRTAGFRNPLSGFSGSGHGSPGRIDFGMDECRVYSWRDEYRQHGAIG